MKQTTQIALAKKIQAHLQQHSTDEAATITRVPITSYGCSKRLASEREQLFKNGVLFAGLSCLVPKPGDYLTDDFCGLPVLLVRHSDGSLRGFLNVCKHRGTRLVEGRGNTGGAFVCPYHGWSYGTAGELRGVPSRQHFDGFDFDNCALTPIAVAEQDGMIWFRPSGKASEPLDTMRLTIGMDEDFASYQLPAYHLYDSRELNLKLNWKLVIDTFLEPYHFPVLHRNTVGPIFFPNLGLFEAFGQNLRQIYPRRTMTEMFKQPESEWDLVFHTAIVYVLFPNTAMVMQRDHVEIWRAFPDANDPAQCTVLLDFYIPEPAVSDKAKKYWDANMDLTVRTVLEEDFPVNAGAQSGMNSGAQSHLTLGRNEPALAYFERTIAAAIGEPLPE